MLVQVDQGPPMRVAFEIFIVLVELMHFVHHEEGGGIFHECRDLNVLLGCGQVRQHALRQADSESAIHGVSKRIKLAFLRQSEGVERARCDLGDDFLAEGGQTLGTEVNAAESDFKT